MLKNLAVFVALAVFVPDVLDFVIRALRKLISLNVVFFYRKSRPAGSRPSSVGKSHSAYTLIRADRALKDTMTQKLQTILIIILFAKDQGSNADCQK